MARSKSAWWMPLGVGAVAVLAGCAAGSRPGDGAVERVPGWSAELGQGTVSSYAELDAGGAPRALGVLFSAKALDGLPDGAASRRHCFDRNRDGRLDLATECMNHTEVVMPLPDAVARRADLPFKWVLLTWQPHGHIPPGVYDVPHFDVHFYMQPMAEVFGIGAGPCGPEFVRCDQFEAARRPVPSAHMHPDFKDVEAVVPAMGNHLVDLTGPEFNKQPFTRTWIYGTYGGQVTFYEEMVASAFLLSRPSACFPIKTPPAVAQRGYYPTQACYRHDARTGDTTVAMEGFVLREPQASAPR
jgi:hypothetical protein